jgi:WD40 repeat protein
MGLRPRRAVVLSLFLVPMTLCVLAVGLGPAAGAVSGRGELWVARYDNGGDAADGADAIGVSPNGSKLFVTGGSHGDYATIAYATNTGEQLWVRRYNGPGNGLDGPRALAVSPNGRIVFVTGASAGDGTGYDYATVAYKSSNGKRLWARRYNDHANGDDFVSGLAVSPDGSTVFVTGRDGGGNVDSATLAYAARSGGRLWIRRSDRTWGNSLAVTPDGSKVIVTGIYTVAYAASTGNEIWVRRFAGQATCIFGGETIAVSATRVFVTGTLGVCNELDDVLGPQTEAYAVSTGTRLWARITVNEEWSGPVSVTDGTKVFTLDSKVRAFSASTGSRLWKMDNYGISSLAVSPDGSNLFATGSSGSDYLTMALVSTTGAKLWQASYNGPGDGSDYAGAIAVSPGGTRVFVTGGSVGAGTNSDFATLAYNAT